MTLDSYIIHSKKKEVYKNIDSIKWSTKCVCASLKQWLVKE